MFIAFANIRTKLTSKKVATFCPLASLASLAFARLEQRLQGVEQRLQGVEQRLFLFAFKFK
jgi:hypothetical protein